MPILAVSGVSSTGKTTLLNLLRVRSDIIVTPEFVKVFAKIKGVDLREMYEMPEEAFLFQLSLIRFLEKEFRAMKLLDNLLIVSDRCPLDSLAYTLMEFERLDTDLKEFYQEELEEYSNFVFDLTNESIDKIFLTVPSESSRIEDDGERLLLSQEDRFMEMKYFQEVFSDERLQVPKYILPAETLDRMLLVQREFFEN